MPGWTCVMSRSPPGTPIPGRPCVTVGPVRTSTVTRTTSSPRTWPLAPDTRAALAIAANAYSIQCMTARLYEVEIEPEVRSWLASLSDRDFGRVDFLVGLLAEHAEDLGEPYTRHLGGKSGNCGSTCCASRPGSPTGWHRVGG